VDRETKRGGAPLASRVDRLRRLARLLDAGVRVPGTRWEIGLDPLIGVVPGAGDVLGAVVSTYILVQSARCGASTVVLLRMLVNIAVDALLGSVPILGDLFDVVWKANLKNVQLLERYLADPSGEHQASRRVVLLLLAGVALLSFGALGVTMLILRAGLHLLMPGR
jgi:hypothetical protein